MRPTRALGTLFATLLLAGLGCSHQTAESLRPTTAFSRAQLDVIMYRRDQGDGLAEIARAVSSTRREVRLAERQEKTQRRQVRR